MKKVLTILLILIMSFSLIASAYAVTGNTDSTDSTASADSTDEILELNLDSAIQYALEHNRDMTIQDLNIKKAEISYDSQMKGVKEFNNLSNAAQKLYPTVDRKLFQLGVIERSAKLSLQKAKWNKELKVNEIMYNVEKAYYDLAQVGQGMEIAKESLELAEKQYEQSKKMFELGMLSKQQLLSIELAVSQAQSGYDSAVMGYEIQKMNFNNTLGLPLDQDIILTDQIQYKEYNEANIEEAIMTAFENSASLKVAIENHELSELTLKATKARYTENTYKYREQEVAVEMSAKSLDMAKNSIEMGIRATYLSLITSEKQTKTYELTVEKAQKALELAELSYELGQNTSTDVTQARIELMNAKTNLLKQIHTYNMALLDFKYNIGLGKTQIVGGF